MQIRISLKSLCLCVLLIFIFGNLQAATPPLVPFDNTGDLYVMDDFDNGSGSILGITPEGIVSVAVSRSEIMSVSGLDDPSFLDCGIAFDADNNLYFCINDGVPNSDQGRIMKWSNNGVLSVLAPTDWITDVTGGQADLEGLAFGSDGMLYVIENDSDVILQVNPSTGAVSPFATEADIIIDISVGGFSSQSGIVGAEGGILYAASDDGNPGAINAIFEFDSAGNASVLSSNGSFSDLELYMTRDINGDIIIADNSDPDTIHRVTAAGTVSTFLSEAVMEGASCVNGEVVPRAGIAFDSNGNFYLPETSSGNIYQFSAGTMECGLFVSEADITAVTGEAVELTGGIAFSRAPVEAQQVPTMSEWGMILLSLLMAASAFWYMRRRSTI